MAKLEVRFPGSLMYPTPVVTKEERFTAYRFNKPIRIFDDLSLVFDGSEQCSEPKALPSSSRLKASLLSMLHAAAERLQLPAVGSTASEKSQLLEVHIRTRWTIETLFSKWILKSWIAEYKMVLSRAVVVQKR